MVRAKLFIRLRESTLQRVNLLKMGSISFYLKENPKGVQEMCKMMEDMRKESLKEVAKRMLADGMLTLEKIAEYAGLSLDEVKKLKAERIA